MIQQAISFIKAHTVRMIRAIGQITGLGVVGIAQMCHAQHGPHALDGGRGYAVIELAFVAHDRVHEDCCARFCLFKTVA